MRHRGAYRDLLFIVGTLSATARHLLKALFAVLLKRRQCKMPRWPEFETVWDLHARVGRVGETGLGTPI
ncbi:hypothetical protein HBI23_095480 [Parastagonospora nodorum]|nr:hypothetical protein HBI79_175950 [Parastagonospora nodorum]KAH5319625.1 hypothetical protein HBI12_105600 [Parastagonospora nodorum]KAH5662927.1 hypothetical protein HBI23_095480 [Parastagonospora nodorum]KAH6463203.1 hypothetical protein HBI57_057530 [Parastagonospora nodorum]KAH6476764.1 hypothetical protein HBI58_112550 [Parastagonospora nodorum]